MSPLPSVLKQPFLTGELTAQKWGIKGEVLKQLSFCVTVTHGCSLYIVHIINSSHEPVGHCGDISEM